MLGYWSSATQSAGFVSRGALAAGTVLVMAGFALSESLPQYKTSPDVLQAPSAAYWLGTNGIGQDVFIGLLRAAPITVFLALITATAALAIALAASSLAAFSGPRLRGAVLRLVDVLQVIPSLLVLLLLAAWIQPGFLGLVVLLSLTGWHEDVRVALPILLRELTRENVHFARRMGASRIYCLRHHILPAIWPAIVGLFLQNVRQAALKSAGFGFLGLTDPRLLTWGNMIQDAMAHLYTDAWAWLLLPPAGALSLFLIGILVIGEGYVLTANPTGKERYDTR
ncbi:ABC transporter permease subunit [Pseudovibrio sp. Tun.PSC04-5.I4]|uniref:ABC transporter permease n=1 Tax=Pseudovibrio sp. Tun.PSC04-5.I4 TaxID=1798213 RepID=UPI00088DA266|nr:ABC transporter permease subunit [Pseudovibrio sp. Tun.PSC04-5.I4]SDQ33647.1 peptide/nickel transport system permease protein [Pseudovibrio sp. Tun.PSC04-5.I4]